MSAIGMRFKDLLVIERATGGTVDEYNQPAQTYADTATIRGFIQPKGTAELALLNQQGPVVATYTLWAPIDADVRDDDRIRDAAGNLYELDNVRDAAGAGAFKKADATRVVVSP